MNPISLAMVLRIAGNNYPERIESANTGAPLRSGGSGSTDGASRRPAALRRGPIGYSLLAKPLAKSFWTRSRPIPFRE
jgi:hypothetical protein